MNLGPSAEAIRHESPEDWAAIRTVLTQAFGRPEEADLVDTLRSSGAITLSLVAARDDLVVGHILFSSVTIESEDGGSAAVGLGPMAVLPAYQTLQLGTGERPRHTPGPVSGTMKPCRGRTSPGTR